MQNVISEVLQMMSFDWSSTLSEIGIKTNDSHWHMISGQNITWHLIPQVLRLY